MDRSKHRALGLTVVLLVFSWKLSVAFLLDLRIRTKDNNKISSSLAVGDGLGNPFRLNTRTASSNNIDGHGQDDNESRQNLSSRVTRISSKNMGGVIDPTTHDGTVHVPLPEHSLFAVCTGDSGVGKSLLLARAIELLSGSKLSPKVLGLEPYAPRNKLEVEMEFHLTGPHAAHAQRVLSTHDGITDKTILPMNDNDNVDRIRLHCKRAITLREPSSDTSENSRTYRLKSLCEINDRPVPLQILSSIVSPLVATVDGSKAALALASPRVRTTVLDRRTDADARRDCETKKKAYRQAREEREALQAQLDNRVLPKGFSMSNEEDAKLLSHWIIELDSFESRVIQLCKSLEDAMEHAEEGPKRASSGIFASFQELAASKWMDNDSSDPRYFHSSIHSRLGTLREAIRSMDGQWMAANNALNALTSLSSTDSVLTALENARRFVEESSRPNLGGSNENGDDALVNAVETCHDLLNNVEEAVKQCARHIEDDHNGLIRTLEEERSLIPVTVEQIDDILLEWGTLARKHGVPALSLPSCHETLKQEHAGNDEALSLFPELVECEERKFAEFVDACQHLSALRKHAAEQLTTAVNERLPALGMKPRFKATVTSNSYTDPDQLLALGADDVRFLLQKPSPGSLGPSATDIHAIASSGETARILLAIECSIPGSIAAACTKDTNVEDDDGSMSELPLPVLVLYDEIDAHMGGHAATALAMMLSEQASSGTSQILAITHSPAVAALADHHIVIQKSSHSTKSSGSSTNAVTVKGVLDRDRTQELARMASGNLATEEAQAFADALIRDGANMRNLTEASSKQ